MLFSPKTMAFGGISGDSALDRSPALLLKPCPVQFFYNSRRTSDNHRIIRDDQDVLRGKGPGTFDLASGVYCRLLSAAIGDFPNAHSLTGNPP